MPQVSFACFKYEKLMAFWPCWSHYEKCNSIEAIMILNWQSVVLGRFNCVQRAAQWARIDRIRRTISADATTDLPLALFAFSICKHLHDDLETNKIHDYVNELHKAKQQILCSANVYIHFYKITSNVDYYQYLVCLFLTRPENPNTCKLFLENRKMCVEAYELWSDHF